MRGDDVLGILCLNRVSGEQVDCYFWSASPGGLGFEEGAEFGEIVVRDGSEELVIIYGHFLERISFRSLNGVDDGSSV